MTGQGLIHLTVAVIVDIVTHFFVKIGDVALGPDPIRADLISRAAIVSAPALIAIHAPT